MQEVLSDALKDRLDGSNGSSPLAGLSADVLLGTRLNELAALGLTTSGNGAALIGILDAGGYITGTNVEAALAELATSRAALILTTAGNGAALIGIQDVGTYITGVTVEAAIQELGASRAALILTTAGNGAALIGIQDVGTYITGVTVEAAIQELGASRAALALTTNGNGAALVGVEDSQSVYTGSNVETVLAELGAVRLFQATGTINNAAVRTLNATPVEVVPTPGPGKAILVDSVTWLLDYTAPGFDAVDAGDDLTLKYTDAAGAQVVAFTAGAGFGDAVADAYRIGRGVDNLTPVANAAVVAHILVGEWYAAAGGSALKYVVHYRVITLPTT